jgi:hypothetical protein
MFGALFYLQYHSVKNRTLMRFKRLRQPKYLAGFVVGGLYLYFYFFRFLFMGQRGRIAWTLSDENRQLLEFAGAFILFVIVVLAWVVPHQRTALVFTEAETAFLFPAPISRRGLIHFKLLRSQTAILFTTILLTVVSNRFGGNVLAHAAGWWLILSTLNLHVLGSSFAITKLMDRGITKWRRRAIVLGIVLVIAAGVLAWARRTMPQFEASQYGRPEDMKDYFMQVLGSGPVPYLLYPFRLVVRPYLAPDAAAFFLALPAALGLLALHYVWVVRANVSFEEASLAASKKTAEKVAAIRSGNWQAARDKPRKRKAPFRLGDSGSPAVAFLWKNLIAAGQLFTARIWLSVAIFSACMALAFGRGPGDGGLGQFVGIVAGMFLLWSLLIGPQLLRQDFRQDLQCADILKSYPLPGWQVVIGELLAPVAILTGIQWFLLILVAGFFPLPHIDGALVLAVALGAAVLMPLLNFITIQIPNAAVLLFPAWFLTQRGGAQGIEATGQRLIFVVGQLLVFLLALFPAAGLSALVFFLSQSLVGKPVAVLLGSALAAVALAIEGSLGIVLLGWLFRRYDVAAEQNA